MSKSIFARVNDRERLASFFTVIAGCLQALAALYILFYPWLVTCRRAAGGGTVCTGQSYTQMNGSLIGYTFLFLFIGLGIGAVISTWERNTLFICAFRWLVVLVSAIFAVVGWWSIGLVFAPGGLLMLLPALSCLRTKINVSAPLNLTP